MRRVYFTLFILSLSLYILHLRSQSDTSSLSLSLSLSSRSVGGFGGFREISLSAALAFCFISDYWRIALIEAKPEDAEARLVFCRPDVVAGVKGKGAVHVDVGKLLDGHMIGVGGIAPLDHCLDCEDKGGAWLHPLLCELHAALRTEELQYGLRMEFLAKVLHDALECIEQGWVVLRWWRHCG